MKAHVTEVIRICCHHISALRHFRSALSDEVACAVFQSRLCNLNANSLLYRTSRHKNIEVKVSAGEDVSQGCPLKKIQSAQSFCWWDIEYVSKTAKLLTGVLAIMPLFTFHH